MSGIISVSGISFLVIELTRTSSGSETKSLPPKIGVIDFSLFDSFRS